MRSRLIPVVVLLFLVPFLALGGTTGKIKGKITDKANGEPLVGATVVVVGTSLGAAANVDGEFIVLNVPAGKYDLQANFVGYNPQKLENVVINADLTTELNFSMTPLSEGVAMKEIVIQVERELINKNATNVTRIQTGEDVKNLPVRGVTAAVALNAGVVQQNGNLYIRGGRREEVGYYLEGASTRNVMDGTQITTVIPEALEEFQIQAGGYNAQYGGANSGIVRQTLRSGTSTLKASFQAETDNYTKQNKEALGGFSYGYSNYVATLSGPLFTDHIKFFVAGENQFDRDLNKYFWTGYSFSNVPSIEGGVVTDTVPLVSMGDGNTPGGMRNRYTGNGTITFDYNPFIVRLGGSLSYVKQQGTTLPARNIFALRRLGIGETSDALINAKLTHIVSPTVLYEVNINYAERRSKGYDPDWGDNFLSYNDSLANAALGFPYRGYTSGPNAYILNGFPFPRYGTSMAGYNKSKQNRIGGSVDATVQSGTIHEIKFGGSFESYTLRSFATGTANLLSLYRNQPDVARTPSANRDYLVRRNGAVNAYGYDVYGNEISSGVDGPKKPLYFAGYLQDKIEYSDLVVNAGIRFDYINNDDIQFIDDPTTPNVVEGPNNPSIDATTLEYKSTGIQKKKAFTALSPRLGFSFPVSDRTVFHLQWGKFIQAPALNQMYIGRGAQAVVWSGGNYIPNPTGYDLDPVRTTSYEVGFTQQFSDFAAFDLTAYYKDVRGQIQVVRQATTADAVARGYNTLANGDFATTQGFELSLRLRRIARVQAQVNYTFSDAKGTGSVSNSAVGSVENGTQYPTVISPLDFEQAHRGSINFDYRFGENDGGPILSRLGLNLLFTFNSGHPYTLSSGSGGQQGAETGALIENDARNALAQEAVNSSTTPWVFNIDMRLDKTVNIGPLTTNFYIYVQNLLNTKNVLNVYKRTGNASDDGFLTDPGLSSSIVQSYGPGYVDFYNAINLVDGQHFKQITGLDLWSTPRQIRFGVRLEY